MTESPAEPQSSLTAVTIDAAAVLFDCDGVLVDSDASVASAWTRWAGLYGLGPETVGEVVHGRRAADTVALLIDEDRQAAALADINAFEVEDAATVTSIAGAVALTDEMPDGTWAVVTSGNRVLAAARLSAAGISAPAVVVTADDVTDGKPHPEGYASAAERLGVLPSLAVVLEDADAGVRAARAAGVAAVIGVGGRALDSDADVVVRDLTWVSWTGDGLLIEPEGMLRGPRA